MQPLEIPRWQAQAENPSEVGEKMMRRDAADESPVSSWMGELAELGQQMPPECRTAERLVGRVALTRGNYGALTR